jgi:hypothetical protein
MNDLDNEKRLFEEYPFHILVMVHAAKKALHEGRARIEDGVLVFDPPLDSPRPKKPKQKA